MARVTIQNRRGRVIKVSPKVGDFLVRRGWQYLTRHMEAGPPPVTVDPFVGVPFASPIARQAAVDAGLNASAFQGRTGSGTDGKFTKPDVLALTGD